MAAIGQPEAATRGGRDVTGARAVPARRGFVAERDTAAAARGGRAAAPYSTRSASPSPAPPSQPRASCRRSSRGRRPAPAACSARALRAQRGRSGARQRHRRARARLRRHVLRLARASERAARRRARSPPAESTGASGARAARRLHRRLRDRSAARPRDESAPLPARLALHVDDRHDRRGRGGSRLLGLDASTHGSRARDCRVGSVRPEGKLRHDGQAAARGAGGAQRRAGGAARAGGHDGERARRSTARRGSCTRWTASATSLGAVIGDLGRRWEILDTGITVKLYPSCAGTHPTLDAMLDLRRRERFTADDVERDRGRRRFDHADDPDLRAAGDRPRRRSSACRSAWRRRSCSAASASTRSTPRCSRIPR